MEIVIKPYVLDAMNLRELALFYYALVVYYALVGNLEYAEMNRLDAYVQERYSEKEWGVALDRVRDFYFTDTARAMEEL